MTTRIRAAWLAILGGVFVAAGPGQAETIDVTFACPDGQMLAVTFLNAAGPEQGFRYADATHELRGKGQSVTWTAGSAKPVTCSERKPAGTGPR
jgi:hypothetical protein